MRNRYAGTCWRCGQHVMAGVGVWSAGAGGGRVEHLDCIGELRATMLRYQEKVGTLEQLVGRVVGNAVPIASLGAPEQGGYCAVPMADIETARTQIDLKE
jgi:hypothetical protein